MHTDEIFYKDALTLDEAANLIGMSKGWIYQKIKKGVLHSRYATMYERRCKKGSDFRNRLLFVSKREVENLYHGEPLEDISDVL